MRKDINNILYRLQYREINRAEATDRILSLMGENKISSQGSDSLPIHGVNFHTVGTLKKALEGLPDDRFIACQVVAKDGKAWNMWGEFCPQVSQGTIACLTFRHDELETLP